MPRSSHRTCWQETQGGNSIDWGEWAPLLWFVILLLGLVAVKRWLSTHLYGLGLLLGGSHDAAILVYFLLLFPGVLMHELSHWIAAKLLRVPVGKINIGPVAKGSGATRLGSVSMAKTDPVRAGLIGMAPLVTGTILILLVAYRVFGLTEATWLSAGSSPDQFVSALRGYLSVPNFWLWVYLVFSISNAMLPSESDRQAWLSLLAYASAVVVVLYGLGLLQEVTSPVSSFFVRALDHLSFAFLLTILVDAAVIVVVLIVERVVMVVAGRKVDY